MHPMLQALDRFSRIGSFAMIVDYLNIVCVTSRISGAYCRVRRLISTSSNAIPSLAGTKRVVAVTALLSITSANSVSSSSNDFRLISDMAYVQVNLGTLGRRSTSFKNIWNLGGVPNVHAGTIAIFGMCVNGKMTTPERKRRKKESKNQKMP